MIRQEQLPDGWTPTQQGCDGPGTDYTLTYGVILEHAGHYARLSGPSRTTRAEAEADLLTLIWALTPRPAEHGERLYDAYQRTLTVGARTESPAWTDLPADTRRTWTATAGNFDALDHPLYSPRAALDRVGAPNYHENGCPYSDGARVQWVCTRLAEVVAETDDLHRLRAEVARLEASDAANERRWRNEEQAKRQVMAYRDDERARADAAEQEVTHLRDRLERTEEARAHDRERLAAQATMIREQQRVIDHLRRPLTARVASRVAGWARR